MNHRVNNLRVINSLTNGYFNETTSLSVGKYFWPSSTDFFLRIILPYPSPLLSFDRNFLKKSLNGVLWKFSSLFLSLVTRLSTTDTSLEYFAALYEREQRLVCIVLQTNHRFDVTSAWYNMLFRSDIFRFVSAPVTVSWDFRSVSRFSSVFQKNGNFKDLVVTNKFIGLIFFFVQGAGKFRAFYRARNCKTNFYPRKMTEIYRIIIRLSV